MFYAPWGHDSKVNSSDGTAKGNLGHAIGFAMPLANAINDSAVTPESAALNHRSFVGMLLRDTFAINKKQKLRHHNGLSVLVLTVATTCRLLP